MHLRTPLLASALLLVTACGGSPAPAATTASVPTGPDAHGISPDEVFVATTAMPEDWSATINVQLARAEKPVEAGAEGVFFPSKGGGEIKTKFFWKSHLATKDEAKPGTPAACFNDTYKDGAYGAPTAANGRTGGWVLGHVSDNADAEKGFVKVGNRKCQLGAVRIVGS